MTTLKMTNISKTFVNSNETFQLSLHDQSLEIEAGECFVLLGPSGCGKTTLLKLIAGLLHLDTGKVEMGERDITHVPAEQRAFGMVFQQALLFPHLTVEENVAFGLKMGGIEKRKRLMRANEVLKAVGLEGYGARRPNELSGGQQQRVSLARAIVIQPKLLLMDEPLSSLDPEIRREIRQLIKKIHKQFETTMVFVTHDRNEAFELADRIAVMANGRILQTGPPTAVYQYPTSPEVAKFLGCGNVWKGEVQAGVFHGAGLQTAALQIPIRKSVDGEGWLVIRPELFRVRSNTPALNVDELEEAELITLQGVIQEVFFRHGVYELIVEVAGRLVDVTEKFEGAFVPQEGAVVWLQFNPQQVHFIGMQRGTAHA